MKSNLNEKQKEAVYLGLGPALILAGPGSGKTTPASDSPVFCNPFSLNALPLLPCYEKHFLRTGPGFVRADS